MKPNPLKVNAITEMPAPQDKAGLQRPLGMVKYLSQYISHELELTAPAPHIAKERHSLAVVT